jgi:hypothetical protein
MFHQGSANIPAMKGRGDKKPADKIIEQTDEANQGLACEDQMVFRLRQIDIAYDGTLLQKRTFPQKGMTKVRCLNPDFQQLGVWSDQKVTWAMSKI